MTTLRLPRHNVSGPFSGDKILGHGEWFQSLINGGNPPPITVEVDLTNICNLSCPYCTNDEYRKTQSVSLNYDVAIDLMREFGALGVKAVTFTGGGEPTLRTDLHAVLVEAFENCMDTALITNGTRGLDDDTWYDFVAYMSWIRFSVDAYDKVSYEHSKGVDAWDKVLSNIKFVAEVKNKMRGLEKATIGVGYLTGDNSAWGMEKAAKVFSQTGVDYLQFRPITYLPTDHRKNEFSVLNMEYWQNELKKYEHDGFKIYYSMPKYDDIGKADRGYSYCSGVFASCVIGATGDVWICCHMRGIPKFSLGNVNERSFTDIWNDVNNRNEVYKRIGDMSECMELCRFHGQNKLLAKYNYFPQHVNFL